MQRKPHIGGLARLDGWEVLNQKDGPHVDHVGAAHDLKTFADNTFTELYASHVLEHLDYVNEVGIALQEWRRVLCPGGCLLISVPDLETLADLFCNDHSLPYKVRFLVMRMIFGGHTDSTDYHQTGFNKEILQRYLEEASFTQICRVETFNVFRDASQIQIKNRFISLNMQAFKPLS